MINHFPSEHHLDCLPMGGFPSSFDDGSSTTTPNYKQGWSIALVGASGSGKSATGNSILGRKAFHSRPCNSTARLLSPAINVCELQTTTVLEDGQLLHVIDTPGLTADCCGTYELTQSDIAEFINTTTGGIHAVVLVVSVDEFTEDDKAAFATFYYAFGKKMADCVILVFTGGDELERRNRTLDDYLRRDCPPFSDMHLPQL